MLLFCWRDAQVPFDKLTDCDNQEPAGAETICCIDRVLHETTVDTASGNRDSGGHELSLQGLVDPEGFKRDVRLMPAPPRGCERTLGCRGVGVGQNPIRVSAT